MPMAIRVSRVALPRCGVSTTFSKESEAFLDLRLALEDVERRPRNDPGAKGLDERPLVHDRPACRVHEDGARAHRRELDRVDQVP